MCRALSRATGILVAILAVASCRGSDSTAPSQSIGIVVSAAELTIMCGYTSVTTATLTRDGGFPGPVTVSVSGLPDGVSASLSPSELTGETTSTTITIVAEETVVPGSYMVTVLASSSIGEASTTYRLVVVEAPHFHLSVVPSALTVAPGTSGEAAVYIDRRGGFSENVALSAQNTTSGVTITFNPDIVAQAASTVTVQVASTVPDGNYAFTVAGATSGLLTTTAQIALFVRSPSTDWSLVAAPLDLTVARGSQGRIEVSVVTDKELPGWATYKLIDPPAGIIAGFEYHYDWGYPATGLIYVAPTVTAGRYTLTLGATFPGTPMKTVTIALTVI